MGAPSPKSTCSRQRSKLSVSWRIAADFREIRSLDNFDFAFNACIDRARIYELAACHFIREQRDALLVGPPGVGKSHLAQAIGIEAIKAQLIILGAKRAGRVSAARPEAGEPSARMGSRE